VELRGRYVLHERCSANDFPRGRPPVVAFENGTFSLPSMSSWVDAMESLFVPH